MERLVPLERKDILFLREPRKEITIALVLPA